MAKGYLPYEVDQQLTRLAPQTDETVSGRRLLGQGPRKATSEDSLQSNELKRLGQDRKQEGRGRESFLVCLPGPCPEDCIRKTRPDRLRGSSSRDPSPTMVRR